MIKYSKSTFSLYQRYDQNMDSNIIKNNCEKAGIFPFSDAVIPKEMFEL